MSALPPVDLRFVVLATLVAICYGALFRLRPAYGLGMLIVIGPFAYYHWLGPTALTLPKVALLAAAVGTAMRKPQLAVFADRPARLVLFACLAVAGAAALSIVVADYRWPATREMLKALEYFGTFVVAAIAFSEDPNSKVIVRSCFAAAIIVSLLALAQEIVGSPTALMNAGHVVARISGPLEGPNQLSGYLGLLLPIMAVQCATNRRDILYWIILAIVTIADFLTFSRAGVASGLIGVGVSLAVLGVSNARMWLLVIGLPVVLGAAAAVFSGGSISRFFSGGSHLGTEGLGTRRELWSAAIHLWRQHPILGIGGDNYEFELARAGYPELRTHPNSQFLQALVEEGLPGLAAFTWATVQPFFTLWSLRKDPLIAGILGACLALGLHQIVDSMSFFPKVGGLLWLLVGVAVGRIALERRGPPVDEGAKIA